MKYQLPFHLALFLATSCKFQCSHKLAISTCYGLSFHRKPVSESDSIIKENRRQIFNKNIHFSLLLGYLIYIAASSFQSAEADKIES